MKAHSTILLSLAAFLTFSCNHRSHGELGLTADYAIEEQIQTSELASTSRANIMPSEVNIPVQPTDRKMIKDGRMGFIVDNISKAKNNATSLVSRYGGYYSNESYSNSPTLLSLDLIIRIPNQSYDVFISELENADGGKLQYKQIDACDVTEEYLDIETRLANKMEYLARYRELVKRANTIKDILEVEQQIRVLEEEIESAEGRLRYMGDRVTYSTLNLNLSEEIEYAKPDGDSAWSRIKDSIATGWIIIVEIFYFFIKIWPLLILGTGLFIFLRNRKRQKANTSKH